MSSCALCPRNCGVDRESKTGYCGQTKTLRLARAALHYWEEPCISGERGSGAVFFSGCPLRCIYCQNREIALGESGLEISGDRLCQIFLELQEQGANNINLVTPTHFVPQIVQALDRAKQQGLVLPIVYNTSSYECVDTLRQLEGLVDVYLPDLKYVSSELSAKYSHASDYFAVASDAIAEMFRQVGEPVFTAESPNGAGKRLQSGKTAAAIPKTEIPKERSSADTEEESLLMTRGLIVRHLVLPGCLQDSKHVIEYLYRTYGDGIYISIMNQFTPVVHQDLYTELNRRLSQAEYDEVVDFAIDLGVEKGFIQEQETAEESFIPPFDYSGVRSPASGCSYNGTWQESLLSENK